MIESIEGARAAFASALRGARPAYSTARLEHNMETLHCARHRAEVPHIAATYGRRACGPSVSGVKSRRKPRAGRHHGQRAN
jgi:hypothetical protein